MSVQLSGELDLKKIVETELTPDQYVQEVFEKTQIVLHHSAGWDNANNMVMGWQADKQRVATSCAIVDDGTVHRVFPSKFWAYHVGFTVMPGNEEARAKFPKDFSTAVSSAIERRSIGVEVCNWGSLTKKADGRLHAWPSTDKHPIVVPEERAVFYPGKFRGFEYYERYTDAEIESLWKLIRYWASVYGIPCKTVGNVFEINGDAIKGTPGVYCHTSYRGDKGDLHPQIEVVEMLNAL